MQINFTEKELEDFLSNKQNLKEHFNLEFIARQVMIPPAGIIDILAYDRDSKCFVIIELKKGLLDSDALIQGMSYLKYYQDVRKRNYIYNKRDRKFALLLIGQDLNSNLAKVVNDNNIDGVFDDGEIYYNLFNFDLNLGVNFTYYSPNQNDYESKINDVYTTLDVNAYYFRKKNII